LILGNIVLKNFSFSSLNDLEYLCSNSSKTILWNDFITAGITQLKDICYEVKTGFLPDNAIVEMVTNVNEDISQDNIVKRYNALKCAELQNNG
jgi:hypothetical protein